MPSTRLLRFTRVFALPFAFAGLLATSLHAAPAPVGDRFAYPADASTDLPVLANDAGTGLTITAVRGRGFSIAPSGLALRFDASVPGALDLDNLYSLGAYTVSGSGGEALAAVILVHPPLGVTPPPVPLAPVSFLAKTIVIDPNNNFYDQSTIWFDHSRQSQRVDVTFLNPNETPQQAIFILKPGQGLSHRITPRPGGFSPPVTESYTLSLNRTLVPASAAFVGHTTEPGAPRSFERWLVAAELTQDIYTGYRRTLPGTSTPVFIPREIQSFGADAIGNLGTSLRYTHFTAFPGPYPDARVFDETLLLPIIP